MGLLKAFFSSFRSTKNEQWKEAFMSDSMGNEILVKRGMKHISKRSTNTRKNDEKITHGSLVVVADGQNALVVRGGEILSAFLEPGEHIYHEPGYKGFFHSFMKDLWEKVTFGGGDIQTGLARIYYINMMESINNEFATPAPIPVKIKKDAIDLDLDTGLMISGTFSYRITDSVLFFRTLSGNVSSVLTRHTLTNHLRSLILREATAAAAILSSIQLEPSELPLYTVPMSERIKKAVNSSWCAEHGIEITGVSVSSLTIKDLEMVTILDRDATYRF